MSVIGGVLLFAAGTAMGAGAVIFNRRSVEAQTWQLRRENEHLKQSAWKDRLEYESDKAFRRGYYEGRKNPMTDIERLADTLESRRVDFRVTREGTTNGQAPKR